MYEFLIDKYGHNIGLMFGINKTIKEWNAYKENLFIY